MTNLFMRLHSTFRTRGMNGTKEENRDMSLHTPKDSSGIVYSIHWIRRAFLLAVPRQLSDAGSIEWRLTLGLQLYFDNKSLSLMKMNSIRLGLFCSWSTPHEGFLVVLAITHVTFSPILHIRCFAFSRPFFSLILPHLSWHPQFIILALLPVL